MADNLRAFIKEHKRQARVAIIAAAIGAVYALVMELTDFRIPCAFHLVTGLSCPGCGVSRFCMGIIHLDFSAAARANVALAVLVPIWLAALIIRALWNPAWLRAGSRARSILLWGSVAGLVLFGIVRNIIGI